MARVLDEQAHGRVACQLWMGLELRADELGVQRPAVVVVPGRVDADEPAAAPDPLRELVALLL